jgi:hypothetical protein
VESKHEGSIIEFWGRAADTKVTRGGKGRDELWNDNNLGGWLLMSSRYMRLCDFLRRSNRKEKGQISSKTGHLNPSFLGHVLLKLLQRNENPSVVCLACVST